LAGFFNHQGCEADQGQNNTLMQETNQMGRKDNLRVIADSYAGRA
jgi:hypothetical protein